MASTSSGKGTPKLKVVKKVKTAGKPRPKVEIEYEYEEEPATREKACR